MTTIGQHEFTGGQIGELLTAEKPADVRLSLWDRFKDLFRSQTKRAEVERIVAALSSSGGAAGVRQKLARFDELLSWVAEEERSRFAAVCQPSQATGGTDPWELRFQIDDQVIAKESIEELLGLRACHAASMYVMLRGLSEHLRHDPEGKLGQLSSLIPKLEESIARCLSAEPAMESAQLRAMFVDVTGEIDRLRGRSALPTPLRGIVETGRAQLSYEHDRDRVARQLVQAGVAIDVADQQLPAEQLARALAEIEGMEPATVEQAFTGDFPRDHITQAESYRIGGDVQAGEPGQWLLGTQAQQLQQVRSARAQIESIDKELDSPRPGGESPQALQGRKDELEAHQQSLVGSLKEEALQKLEALSLSNPQQKQVLTALLTQKTQIVVKRMLEDALAHQPITLEDTLNVNQGDWARAWKETRLAPRPDAPWIVNVSFVIEADVTKLNGFDLRGRAVPVELQPGSVVRMEVYAELENGRLRPVDALFDAHLIPRAANEVQSGAHPGIWTGLDFA